MSRKGPLDLGERARVDGNVLAEVTGGGIDVDVVRTRGIGLRGCSASWSGVRRILQDPRAVAGPSPSSPVNRSGARQSSPGACPRRLASSRRNPSSSCGEPNACCDNAISSRAGRAVIGLSIRWAAAERCARVSMSSSTDWGSQEEAAVSVHEVGEPVGRVVAALVGVEQVR